MEHFREKFNLRIPEIFEKGVDASIVEELHRRQQVSGKIIHFKSEILMCI